MLVSNSLPFKSSLVWFGMGHTAAHWHKLVLMGPTGLNFNGRDNGGHGGHGGLSAADATLRT